MGVLAGGERHAPQDHISNRENAARGPCRCRVPNADKGFRLDVLSRTREPFHTPSLRDLVPFVGTEDATMTRHRIPNWLQADLLIISLSLAMIGVGVFIAP